MKKETKLNLCSVGRRKTSIARISLLPNEGQEKESFSVNNRNLNEYFQYNFFYLQKIQNPLQELGLSTSYQVSAFVKGGGLSGQANAIKLALAKALCEIDVTNHRPKLKAAGYLSRDARIKERRKYGLKKARKASQSSKR